MEENFNAGVTTLELYRKPSIVGDASIGGVMPLAALAGLSAAKLAVIGVALGLGVGSAATKLGVNGINSSHTKILAARKNFALG